jgi:hypothetical protein
MPNENGHIYHLPLTVLHLKMKRCPTCQRTFDDNMKFCQADGTPLVADAGGSQASSGGFQEENFDPMKTILAQPPPKDLPPPSPFGGSNEPPPKSAASDLGAPSFGDLGGSSSFEPEPQRREPTGGGAFGSSQSPSGGFADAPRTPSFQEPEPAFGQQPFGQSPSDWTPPPAPAASWGNQGLGQNTPFSAPPAAGGGQGQNQTLAIVSLVCGILGLCCGVLGPVGLITGYMAYNNANKNPMMYGGRGLALGGMITGGLATLLLILGIILNIAGVVLMPR